MPGVQKVDCACPYPIAARSIGVHILQYPISEIFTHLGGHILWGLLCLGPFCLILTISSRGRLGRGATITVCLCLFVAACWLHRYADWHSFGF